MASLEFTSQFWTARPRRGRGRTESEIKGGGRKVSALLTALLDQHHKLTGLSLFSLSCHGYIPYNHCGINTLLLQREALEIYTLDILQPKGLNDHLDLFSVIQVNAHSLP